MDPESLKQLFLLKMRKACCDMEIAIQCATRESARGEWQSDWFAYHREAQAAFDYAEASLRAN